MNFELNYRQALKVSLLLITLLVALGINLLLKSPALAQNRQVMPRIEAIGKAGNTAPYRLTLSRSEDIVFVYCPANYAPKLGYLRNVETIQCQPL